MSPKRSAALIGSSVSKVAVKKQKQSSLSAFFSSDKSVSKSPTGDTKLSSTVASTLQPPRFKIFCDLDGVLCDFEAGVKKLFNGRGSAEIPNQGAMWGAISKADQFYVHLPWTPDGKRLWKAIGSHKPDILTGVPRTKKCREQKAKWCARELGVTTNHVDMAGKNSRHERVSGQKREGVVNVVTCWSKNKHREGGHGTVLIDDRSSLATQWEKAGGIFIHHTDTETTLEKLKQHGILSSTENEDTQEEKEPVVSSPSANRPYDMPIDTP